MFLVALSFAFVSIVSALAPAHALVRREIAVAAPPAVETERPQRGRFLVATRRLTDPSFAESVVLVLEANADGAVGVVVNRPSPIALRTILPGVPGLSDRDDNLFLGGPVGRFQLLLLVRASAPPPESLRVLDEIFVTGSREALDEAARAGGGTRFRLFAGYAGWAPGQLEAEIARGDWLVAPGDPEAVFAEEPGRLWEKLLEREEGRWVRGRAEDGRLADAGRRPPEGRSWRRGSPESGPGDANRRAGGPSEEGRLAKAIATRSEARVF